MVSETNTNDEHNPLTLTSLIFFIVKFDLSHQDHHVPHYRQQLQDVFLKNVITFFILCLQIKMYMYLIVVCVVKFVFGNFAFLILPFLPIVQLLRYEYHPP